jgi:hypothetical protein
MINKIFTFLGKEELLDTDAMVRMNALLETRQTAVDAALLYGRIPNIEEIERTFGSADSGSLFAAQSQASSR